jgi:hypothetical protein
VTSAQKVSASSRLRLLIQAFSFSIRKSAWRLSTGRLSLPLLFGIFTGSAKVFSFSPSYLMSTLT